MQVPVQCKVYSMGFAQTLKRSRVYAVERGIPTRGKQTIVHVETLCV